MTNITLQHSNNDSPFESIKRCDENRQEYWMARELMVVLGYVKWQKFKDVIEAAQENVETVTDKVSGHFLPVEVKSQGRPSLDYQLSRLAAYHVALSCDSRGNEQVRLAKHYFAVKTREAETIIPEQDRQLEMLKLALELEKQKNQGKLLDDTMLKLHGKEVVLTLRGCGDQVVESEKPIIEVIDERHNVRYEGQTCTQLKQYLEKKFGIRFKSGAEVRRALESAEKELGISLVASVPRSILQPFVPKELLDQAIAILSDNHRQMLLGE